MDVGMTGPTTELHVTFAACEGISAARRRLTEDEVFDELLGDPGLPRKDLGPALPGLECGLPSQPRDRLRGQRRRRPLDRTLERAARADPTCGGALMGAGGRENEAELLRRLMEVIDEVVAGRFNPKRWPDTGCLNADDLRQQAALIALPWVRAGSKSADPRFLKRNIYSTLRKYVLSHSHSPNAPEGSARAVVVSLDSILEKSR